MHTNFFFLKEKFKSEIYVNLFICPNGQTQKFPRLRETVLLKLFLDSKCIF
jgi:hypothetical protein